MLWLLSLVIFLGFSLLVKPQGAEYAKPQLVLLLTIVITGSIAFLILSLCLVILIFKKAKLLRINIFFLSIITLLILLSIAACVLVLKATGSKPMSENSVSGCNRKEMYEMPAEFKRALSLIDQRYTEKNDPNALVYKQMLNCVNIQFSDVQSKEGAEGYFTFDTNASSTDKLQIYVDNSYRNYDDLTTAFLLSHELTHARQLVDEVVQGKKLSCLNKETEAFFQQRKFESYLNEEEQKSLMARAEKADHNNPQLSQLVTLIDISWEALLEVSNGNPNKTFSDEEKANYSLVLSRKIGEMVASIPAYQEQCNL